MTRHLVLVIEDDAEADALIRDMKAYPDRPLLTPVQENQVHAGLAYDYQESGA